MNVALIGVALGVPASLARVAAMIFEKPCVSSSDIEQEFGFGKGCGRVYIQRLRKHLRRYNVELRSSHGAGYYISDGDLQMLTQEVDRFVTEAMRS